VTLAAVATIDVTLRRFGGLFRHTVPVQGVARSSGRLMIRLFGPLAVEDGLRSLGPRDLGGARPKQVLEVLLAARGHRVPTDRLGDLLWGDQQPQNAAGSLQTFVSVLRRHLVRDREQARELVVTEPEAYRFAIDLVALDLDCFDELLERSAREPTRTARRSLERALSFVRGDVLEDEPYAVWAQELRNTYQGRVLGAHLEAAEAALAELDYADALAHTQAGVALDRFSERAHRLQMLALYALGRQHDALEAYRAFRRRLDDELGLEPTVETRALETAVLRQDDLRSLLPRPILHEATGDERSVHLLGRTAELGKLDRAIRQALEGSGTLVLIEGEAGLGKTRLLDELATSLVGVRVGRASCSALERHLPYVPLAAALRDALIGVEIDGQRLPGLRRMRPELALHEAEHGLAEVDALEALVELIAEHAPLVLFLDDLQWADASTIAALSYLQRRCADVPTALVAAIRGEETPPDHPARRLRPDALTRLEPLTAADLTPLGIPDLHNSTGGNPRFVTEVIARGHETGLTDALAESLLAQCRAEGSWAYRVLLAASVLEQPFEPEPLAAVLRVDATEVVEELDRLCERRILRVDGPRFRFRYGLVRQALRASLSPARARLLREQLDQRKKLAPTPTDRAAASMRS
jgi:DNA-binding SARP family transcriptional activator